jgi:hypothetical protein
MKRTYILTFNITGVTADRQNGPDGHQLLEITDQYWIYQDSGPAGPVRRA